jgi:hypothetical protein
VSGDLIDDVDPFWAISDVVKPRAPFRTLGKGTGSERIRQIVISMLFKMLSLYAELGYTLSKYITVKLARSFQCR